jgi:hypothetical protein
LFEHLRLKYKLITLVFRHIFPEALLHGYWWHCWDRD